MPNCPGGCITPNPKPNLAVNYSLANLNGLHATFAAQENAAVLPAKTAAASLTGQFEVFRGNGHRHGNLLSDAFNAGIIIVGGRQTPAKPLNNLGQEAGIIIVGGHQAAPSINKTPGQDASIIIVSGRSRLET